MFSAPLYSQKNDEKGHDHDEGHANHQSKSHEDNKIAHDQDEEKDHDDEDHNESISHDHHGAVSIKTEDLGLFEVEIVKVKSGEIKKLISIPGEVSLNKDKITHVVPRASGIVTSVHKNIGEKVKKGDLLATLESAELADAKSKYLSSLERLSVDKEIFELVEKLKKQGVSFSKEYLDAKSQFAEANIQSKNAKQKLLTYGLKEKELENISAENISRFMQYQVFAPIEGIVLDKHISIGEFIKDDRVTMTIVNLDDVWINLNVFQDDFPHVIVGTEVDIVPRNTKKVMKYKIDYMAPVVNETTRTGLARVIAINKNNLWRPGEFIKGSVIKNRLIVNMLVPKSAVQSVNGKKIVFVEDNEHIGTFFPKEVVLGESDAMHFEIASGLELGDNVVSKGSFMLKAQASKAELEDGHNH